MGEMSGRLGTLSENRTSTLAEGSQLRRQGADLDALRPGEVIDGVGVVSIGSEDVAAVGVLAAVTGAFFWYVDGVLAMSLAEVVSKVVNRRAALQALQPAQVRALLASFDLGRPAGAAGFRGSGAAGPDAVAVRGGRWSATRRHRHGVRRVRTSASNSA
jgi:hypothetical protein